MLRAALLGTSQVDLQGKPLSHKLVGKELALFAYLSMNPELCPRAKLLDLLWTEINEQKARENLRSLLYSLRQTIGDYLIVTRQAVGLNRHMPYWLDVEVFRTLPAQMASHDPGFWSEVLSLYSEDLLDGFSISGAPVFDAWLAEQRDQLRTRAISGWQQLVRLHVEQQCYEEAIVANRRLLALAPWSEEAHRQQMQLLVATGQRSAALAHYELCRRRLQDELDVLPSSETVELYNTIRAQSSSKAQGALRPTTALLAEVQETGSNAASSRMLASPPLLPEKAVNGHAVEHRGPPVSPSTICGRQYELTQLQQWIRGERCQCVAVVGLAGEGKSTLVQEAVRRLTSSDATEAAFAGAVVFSCRNPLPVNALLQAWLAQLSGQQAVTLPNTLDRQLDLLAEHLQRRAFLFVLDDFDYCFAEESWATSADQAAFWQIWRLFIDRPHRSTLLITGRRLPLLHGLAESPYRFRQLSLSGLELQAGHQLLKRYGLEGSSDDFSTLHCCYSGNPLMLKLAAQTIDQLFGGCIAVFLQEQAFFIGAIGEVLKQQLSALTPLERSLLVWLALEGRPLPTQTLWESLTPAPSKHTYFTALQRLSCASLLEVHNGLLHIHSLIRQYIHSQLAEQIFDEMLDSVTTCRLTGATLHSYAIFPEGVVTQGGGAGPHGLPIDGLLDRLQRTVGKEQLTTGLRQLLVLVDADERSHSLSTPGAPGGRTYARDNLRYLLTCSMR